MAAQRTIETLLLDGGRPSLDFTNTVSTRKGARVHEYLVDFGEWLKWCGRSGLLPSSRLARIAELASKHPRLAHHAWQKVMTRRETIYRVFLAHSTQNHPGPSDLALFNDLVSEARARQCFIAGREHLQLGWPQEPTLDEPLWRVAVDAVHVLTEADPSLIKGCDACGWLFLDNTKNHKRRWCNPLTCGSDDKAKRYYWRKKQEKSQEYS